MSEERASTKTREEPQNGTQAYGLQGRRSPRLRSDRVRKNLDGRGGGSDDNQTDGASVREPDRARAGHPSHLCEHGSHRPVRHGSTHNRKRDERSTHVQSVTANPTFVGWRIPAPDWSWKMHASRFFIRKS